MKKRLREFVVTKAEITRSANIEHDLDRWLTEKPQYIDTPLGRSAIQRVIAGIPGNGNRSWCFIGPYGSGKSTVVLALSQLLCGSSPSILDCLRKDDPELAKAVECVRRGGAFAPIFVSGNSGSLVEALRKSLLDSITGFAKCAEDYTALSERFEATPDGVCALVEHFSATYTGPGLFIAVDELGKFIEYSVERSSSGDVFVLQMLAEIAARSDKPILLITVLHQAFARYASLLSEAQRDEFTKVQGRFEAVSFQQPVEQVLTLIGAAIDLHDPEGKVRTRAESLAKQAWIMGLAPGSLQKEQFVRLLVGCTPLHPLTSLLIGPLFRKLAQNERSVFAFLSSREPFGLQQFLETNVGEEEEPPFLTPDVLYDYVSQAYGTSLYQYSSGRKWAQLETALERVVDPSDIELRVIKLIGLLSAIGDQREIGPKKEILSFALSQYGDVDSTLKKLERESILVWRSFSNTYRLWDGSDIDIEERLLESRRKIDDGQALDSLLSELEPPRPLIARHHSHRTGTLRFFETMYASANSLTQALEGYRGEQGRVIYFLTESDSQTDDAVERLTGSLLASETLLITVLHRVEPSCKKAALELKRLYWVEQNTPELSEDLVARRELASRIVEARKALNVALARASESSGDIVCLHGGNSRSFSNWRLFNRFLSDACDHAFDKAPEIRNELINRDHLSSAAAKARRDLLEAMIINGNIEDLGIESFPPQKSMYLSVLKSTGLHTQGNRGWGFSKPLPGSVMRPVWDAWESFLQSASVERRPLSELWRILRLPPYGLSDGVIPVLIVAMLLERSLEAALYVEGSFVPNLTVPLAERFVKNPDRFEVRFCRITEEHRELLRELTRIGSDDQTDEANVLSAVRPLCHLVAQLPPYSRNTHSISVQSQRVREAILAAKDPSKLLFDDLAVSLELTPLSALGNPEAGWIKEFARQLSAATNELASSYRALLDRVLVLLNGALCPDAQKENTRLETRKRAQVLKPYAIDLRVKGFINRLSDDALDLDRWIESVATFVAGKPPQSWNDEDVHRFELNLSELSRMLERLDRLAYVLLESRGDKRQAGGELAMKVSRSASRISQVLLEEFGNEDNDLKLAALAEFIEKWTKTLRERQNAQEEAASAKEEF